MTDHESVVKQTTTGKNIYNHDNDALLVQLLAQQIVSYEEKHIYKKQPHCNDTQWWREWS